MIRAPQGYLLWRAYNLKIYEREWGCVKNDMALSVRKLDYRNGIFCPCLYSNQNLQYLLSAIWSDMKKHASTALGLKSLRYHRNSKLPWAEFWFALLLWDEVVVETSRRKSIPLPPPWFSWDLVALQQFWQWPLVWCTVVIPVWAPTVDGNRISCSLYTFLQLLDAECLITEHLFSLAFIFFSIPETL